MSTEPLMTDAEARAIVDANRLADDVLQHFSGALSTAHELLHSHIVPIRAHGVVIFSMPDREHFHLLTVKHGEIQRLGGGLVSITFTIEDPDA